MQLLLAASDALRPLPGPRSERFVVGGHEWVLLFYPDGKRSSSEMHNIQPAQVPAHNAHLAAAAAAGGAPPGHHPLAPPGAAQQAANGAAPRGAGAPPMLPAPPGMPRGGPGGAAPAAGAPPGAPPPPPGAQLMVNPAAQLAAAGQQQAAAAAAQAQAQAAQAQAQAGNNEYCALFVALIGETDAPQGVVNTNEGRVVRAFHRFTLVDQSGALLLGGGWDGMGAAAGGVLGWLAGRLGWCWRACSRAAVLHLSALPPWRSCGGGAQLCGAPLRLCRRPDAAVLPP